MRIEQDLPELSFNYVRAARRSKGILADLTEAELHDAKVRYQKFLVLKSRFPERVVAPTELIDAVWHLHMLHPRAYYADCMQIFGFILDHNPGFGDDEATRPRLLDRFDATAALWKSEFGDDYSPAGLRFHGVIICADEEDDDDDDDTPTKPPTKGDGAKKAPQLSMAQH